MKVILAVLFIACASAARNDNKEKLRIAKGHFLMDSSALDFQHLSDHLSPGELAFAGFFDKSSGDSFLQGG